MAPLSYKKTYRLEVVGGNSNLHGASLKTDNEGVLAVTNKPANPELRLSLLQPAEDNSSILRAADKTTPQQPASLSGFYFSLQGPSGKGSYQFKLSQDPQPHGLGMQIKFDEWKVMVDGDRLLLRYDDPACCSHWIAVLETSEGGEQQWVPWWVSPNAANMDDFEEYRLIDIELVEENGR